MRIYLTKGDKLFSYKLPEKVEGNYWLDEVDSNGINRNIINISSSSDNNWKIISNNDYYLAAKNQIIPSTILEKNNIFPIHNRYSSDLLVLYACPIFDETVAFYNCTKELEMGITIGKNSAATIACSNIFAGDNDVLIIELITKHRKSNYRYYFSNKNHTQPKIVVCDLCFMQ